MQLRYHVLQVIPNSNGFKLAMAVKFQNEWVASYLPFPMWALVEDEEAGEQYIYPVGGRKFLNLVLPGRVRYLGIALPGQPVEEWDDAAAAYGRRQDKYEKETEGEGSQE